MYEAKKRNFKQACVISVLIIMKLAKLNIWDVREAEVISLWSIYDFLVQFSFAAATVPSLSFL